MQWGCSKDKDDNNEPAELSVTTNPVTFTSQNSATAGGVVTGGGGSAVTARGVCWSASETPAIGDPHTTDGSGTGSYTSSITGLSPHTSYYVRAYATTSAGTVYGSQVLFTTLSGEGAGGPCPGNPIVTYEGQAYNTIQIGLQCWFRENLNAGTMVNGAVNQTNNNEKEKYCYENDSANCKKYGGLYQWDEMMQYTAQSKARGICPEGWHVPSDDDWCALTEFIDAAVDCASTGWSGTDIGEEMKTASGWFEAGNGTNGSGFSALPAGFNSPTEGFTSITEITYFWSSDEKTAASAWLRILPHFYSTIGRSNDSKSNGFSVRCVKD
jgi:uncharacterized protein (TIGR02145 family)